MARISNKERFIRYLTKEIEASNADVRSALNVETKTFLELKRNLLTEGLIEVFPRRGGGLRLTKKGEKSNDTKLTKKEANERELYAPFLESLKNEIDESSAEVVWDIHSKKRLGKWMNPDLVKISVEKFEYLRLSPKVFITTYEVKTFKDARDIKSAFEAAAHKRFSHASYLVIEVPENEFDDFQSDFDEIGAECIRLGIGLISLKRSSDSTKYEHFIKIKAEEHNPLDGNIELFLSENIGKDKTRKREYDTLFV